jgi:hypothetical protein
MSTTPGIFACTAGVNDSTTVYETEAIQNSPPSPSNEKYEEENNKCNDIRTK